MNQQRKHWIESLAKAGYVAKGMVYILVGALTAMTAFGIGGKKASNTDALLQVKNFPGGGFLLGLLAIGLLGYCVWRIVQAFNDTEHKGSDAKGMVTRIGYAISGLLYGSLAFIAFKMMTGGSGNTGGGNREQNLVSGLLDKPFGKYLAIAIGLIVIIKGISQLYKGVTASFLKDVTGMPRDRYNVLKKAGQAGFSARGVVFSIIGFLFARAAWHQQPSEAGGTTSAFSFLQTSPFGNMLLAIVALGLIGYGIFMFVQAKYSNFSIR